MDKSKDKYEYTLDEINQLRELISLRNMADKNTQKKIRNKMRKLGFWGRDKWGIVDCKLHHLEELIASGKIKVV